MSRIKSVSELQDCRQKVREYWQVTIDLKGKATPFRINAVKGYNAVKNFVFASGYKDKQIQAIELVEEYLTKTKTKIKEGGK